MKQKHKLRVVHLILLSISVSILLGCTSIPHTKQGDVNELLVENIVPETNIIKTKTYVNTKHAFTFSYPKTLARKKEYQDNDGMYFMNDDASLLIWGSSKDMDIAIVQTSLTNNNESVQPNYTIRKYDKNELRTFHASRQKEKILIQIEFTYPIALEEVYAPMAEHLLNEITQ